MVSIHAKGIVRGKMIELDQDSGLPEGQTVDVVLNMQSENSSEKKILPGFGSWSGDLIDVDAFLEETYRLRELESDRDLGL